MVSRSSPREHRRRLQSGKTIVVNRGVRRRRIRDNKLYDIGTIRNKTQENKHLQSEAATIRKKMMDPLSLEDLHSNNEKLRDIRKDVASNNMLIDRLRKKHGI